MANDRLLIDDNGRNIIGGTTGATGSGEIRNVRVDEQGRIMLGDSTATIITSGGGGGGGTTQVAGGTVTVLQGTSPWVTSLSSGTVTVGAIENISHATVTVDNFPSVQPVIGSVSIAAGTVAVSNFPTIQPVSGSVSITAGSVSILAGQQIIGTATIRDGGNTISVDDDGGSLTVDATNLDIRDLTSASDSVAAAQSGAWAVSAVGSVSITAGTVSVSNLPTVQAVSGSVSITVGTVSIGPGSQIIGTVSVSNLGTVVQSNVGSVSITAGTVSISAGSQIIGTVSVSNLASVQSVVGSVSITAGTVSIGPGSQTIGTATARYQILAVNAAQGSAIGTNTGTVVGSNPSRKGLVLTNIGPNNVYFGINNTAVLYRGISLVPGGVWVMDSFTYTTDVIHAISMGANNTVTIQEFV